MGSDDETSQRRDRPGRRAFSARRRASRPDPGRPASCSMPSRAPRRAPSAVTRCRALGPADRHHQMRRWLHAPVSMPATGRTVLTSRRSRRASDPEKWDRQKAVWIRKVKLEDNLTGRVTNLPMMCQHCEHPPCVDVCPTGGLLQARGRHRHGGSPHLHRLPLLHDGLPLQGAVSFIHRGRCTTS